MILLVNDDGIHAPGLRSLHRALRAALGMPVLAVAPVTHQSGQSHAITLDRGLSISPHLEDGFFGFAVDGTPTDCVKLGIKVLCPAPPTLVIAGINDGPNVGRSLFYSGTVGVAMEAAVEGCAGLAISRDRAEDDLGTLDQAAAWAARLAAGLVKRRDLQRRVLNLNLPAGPVSGWKELRVVPHGLSGFEESYRPLRTGNRLTWQLAGQRVELAEEGETDAHALKAGHPTLTMLAPDLNCRRGIGEGLLRSIHALVPTPVPETETARFRRRPAK